MTTTEFGQLSRLIRSWILTSTTEAGSGHPTSSLSAVELMVALLFGGSFHFDVGRPENPDNDRLIFSKGHASPLFYALWAAANAIPAKELITLRTFGSRLEGHPAMSLPYTEAATGSLGQGLSIGVGMALAAKLDGLPYRTYVLLGDSEMSEGSQWEAIQLAGYRGLDNLVGILDVNRLGQRGQTMLGHDLTAYEQRIAAFGWNTIVLADGHDLTAISRAYEQALKTRDAPTMIIAKTIKGKGVSFIEDKDGWHGKALSPAEFERALAELGEVDPNIRGEILPPEKAQIQNPKSQILNKSKNQNLKLEYRAGDMIATRKAYGNALVRLGTVYPELVVLDAEVSNSTYAEIFKKAFPDRFFEMYIAEQNMVGAALGLARRGKLPFVSTFAAFFTRAFDQIRMSQYSNVHIVFCGSHAGVSIGEDGPSQMGLEDLAMFRAIQDSIVLYPSDAIATEKLVDVAAAAKGIIYLRTTRKETPVIYGVKEAFPIGGSKTLRQSNRDGITIVAAGITLFEALSAADELQSEGVGVRVIDCYSVKPIDGQTLRTAAEETKAIITVEDHYPAGGLGEAVAAALAPIGARVEIMAVRKIPKSGKPEELLQDEEISKNAIIKKIRAVLANANEGIS